MRFVRKLLFIEPAGYTLVRQDGKRDNRIHGGLIPVGVPAILEEPATWFAPTLQKCRVRGVSRGARPMPRSAICGHERSRFFPGMTTATANQGPGNSGSVTISVTEPIQTQLFAKGAAA